MLNYDERQECTNEPNNFHTKYAHKKLICSHMIDSFTHIQDNIGLNIAKGVCIHLSTEIFISIFISSLFINIVRKCKTIRLYSS